MPPLLELACFTPSAILQNTHLPTHLSAHRIELSTNRSKDGLTPSKSQLDHLLSLTRNTEKPSPPIRILIRPHARDFTYSDEEVTEMRDSISYCHSLGGVIEGVVFGVLKPLTLKNSKHSIDQETCTLLLATAKAAGLTSVFHRAFDELAPEDMPAELEVLIKLGFAGVLTSGGARTAVEGMEVLRRLVLQAGDRIEVIVGGGVRSGNLKELVEGTGARAFHSSAVLDAEGEMPDGEEIGKVVSIINEMGAVGRM